MASDHKFGTGEGALVYQTRRCGRLVQEKGLLCTKRDDVAGWYRRRGFGVPNAKMWQVVQEKGFWCTKREDVAVWYRRRGFGVPTASDHKFGTGEGLWRTEGGVRSCQREYIH